MRCRRAALGSLASVLDRLIQGYVPTFETYSASFARPAGWASRPSTTTSFDALGRGVGGVSPEGALAVIDVAGLTTTSFDPNGNRRTNTADAFGRTISVQEPQGATTTSNIFGDDFASLNSTNWTFAGQTLGAGTVKSVGTGSNWDRTFYRATAAISGGTNGQGVTVEFKLSGTDPTTVLALQSPAGAPYRRLGINTSGNKLYVQYMADAQTWVYPTDLVNPLVKDVWYVLRLQVLPSGVGTVEVWRKDNPGQKWGYVAPMPDGVTYQFQHWVWGGTSWLDNYQEYNLVAPATWTTSYQYDVLDRLTRVTDSLNATTVITYNALGQKTGMLDPDMGPWSYAYDPAGNLSTQTDARGCVTTFSYDLLNRLTGKTYAGLGACGTTTPVTYGYDAGTNGAGQRTSLVDASGITAWAYDTRGQVITETRTITGTGSFTTAFGYDAAGRVLTTTYPTGEVITQSYNLASQLLQVRSSTYGTSYASGLQYNAFGQPLTATLGNNVVIANTYDPRSGRLIQTVSKIGSTPRLDLAYAYDLGGNVTQIVDAVRNETSAYTYDMLDRLLTSSVNVSGVGLVRSETYAYGPTGNIQAVTRWPETTHLGYGAAAGSAVTPTITGRGAVTGLSGGAASLAFVRGGDVSVPLGGAWLSASYFYSDTAHVHAATSLSSGATFTYDANGNMIGRVEGGRVYTQTFDAENRLVSVAQAGVGSTQYIYNGDGQLTKQVNPDGTGTLYLGVVEHDLTSGGAIAATTSYYAVPGARAVRNGAGLFYVLTDYLGSASVSLDSGGNVVAEMRYDAFGATRLAIGNMPGDRLYTGQQFRAEVGLYYFNARWYSPYLGRWASPDSIVPHLYNPQSLNRFGFVRNNPLRYVDPTGHRECMGPQVTDCLPSRTGNYYIRFTGDWTAVRIAAVRQAIEDVGWALAARTAADDTPWEAFQAVFGTSDSDRLVFEWNETCTGCRTAADNDRCGDDFTGDCAAGGAVTVNSHHIMFAEMSGRTGEDGELRRRNHVVHELGHAFNGRLGSNPYNALALTLATNAKFPNRESLPTDVDLGPDYGFASQQGVFTWQQNSSGEHGEEFADMFLGWTYGMWASGIEGAYRAAWMGRRMLSWITP